MNYKEYLTIGEYIQLRGRGLIAKWGVRIFPRHKEKIINKVLIPYISESIEKVLDRKVQEIVSRWVKENI